MAERLKLLQGLKVGVDLDDTFCPTTISFIDYLRDDRRMSFDEGKMRDYRFEESLGLPTSKVSELFQEFYDSKRGRRMKPYPEAVDALTHLGYLGCELHANTSRVIGMERLTLEWIENNAKALFEDRVHFSASHNNPENGRLTKAQICLRNGVRFMIEDDPKYAEQCADAGIQVLLVDRPYNQHIPTRKRITRLKSRADGDWIEVEVVASILKLT